MSLKLNVGSCDLPLPKPWINIDISTSPHIVADLILDGRELDSHFSPNSVDEIYAGHFVEHLAPKEAFDWMIMCYQILRPGGKLGFVTPDTMFIMKGYVTGDPMFTIKELVDTYVFSYKQESHHASMWDYPLMAECMGKVGFTNVNEIDRMEDERLAYPAPWQCGVEGTK